VLAVIVRQWLRTERTKRELACLAPQSGCVSNFCGMSRPSFELSSTFQSFRTISVDQDPSNLGTHSGYVSNSPRSPKIASGWRVNRLAQILR
jgi:hypothetical protein